MIRRITTIDAHVAGEPLRLLVGGGPRPAGATMAGEAGVDAAAPRRATTRAHTRTEGARRHVRCDADRTGGAGVLFMHHEGYSTMCGHGIIAVVTIALERGLLSLPDRSAEVVLDTPAESSPFLVETLRDS